VDWTILGTVWLLALVALSNSARIWVPGSALAMAVHAIFILRVLGVSSLGLARLAASAYAMTVTLAVFAALRPTLRTHAEMAVRRAELVSQSASERAAAGAIHEDRRDRLALLKMEVLPLLRGIAAGTLDPADSAVRGRCAQQAAALRRALVDRSHQAGGLLAVLEPALRAARARGLPVEIQVIGDPGHPTADVARATLAAVSGVLGMLSPQPVILTVLASGNEVELYLAFELAPAGIRDAAGLGKTFPPAAAWQATVEVGGTGGGCLEVRWRAT
jgi:hypothetical protein